MDIDGLRHIVTPTIGYSYSHTPTIQSEDLKQIDSVDSLAQSNAANLGLSNKLQTKRNGQVVDLVDFRVTSVYIFKSKADTTSTGGNLSDILFDLKILPFSWLRVEADATYKHSGSRTDPLYNSFSNGNYDVVFNFGKERFFAIGQRYQKKGGNQITNSLQWRLNPKWKFSTYARYNLGNDPSLARGVLEQEYTVTRDLHCWEMDVTLNNKKDGGTALWLIFRLKAFPEMEFGFNQSYNKPQSGSQSNP
jgi:hypothetical protein